ncbi:MAG: lipid II flippase MurJ [bacterium]|nr:lipid II flippase MurJ [bacterium]
MIERVPARYGRHVGTVILANAVLGVAAVAREVVLAANWGTSPLADAYLLAMYLPDFVGHLLVGSVLHLAAVPFLARAAHQSLEHLDRASRRLMVEVAVVMGVFAVACGIAAPSLIRLLGPGLTPAMQGQAVAFLRWMLPALVFYPLYGLGSGRHLARGSFWQPACGPVVLATTVVVSLAVAARTGRLELMGLGHALGTAAMCALQLGRWVVRPGPAMATAGFHPAPVYRAALPLGLAVVAGQFAVGVERAVASGLGAGTIAALNYAVKVVNFPLWIFVTAITTVTFAELSQHAADGDRPGAIRRTLAALRLVLFVSTPLAVATFFLRRQVLAVLFGYGAFDAAAVAISARVLAGYALFVPAGAIVFILSRSFHARSEFRVPLRAAVAGAGLMAALLVTMPARLGPAALGWAATGGAWLHAGVLGLVARSQLDVTWQRLGRGSAQLLVAVLPPALVAWLAARFVGDAWLVAPVLARAMGAGLVAVTVSAAYIAGCALSGIRWPEEFSLLGKSALQPGQAHRSHPVGRAGS